MYIQTETTPNPQTLKFNPGLRVLPSGCDVLEFSKDQRADQSPLANRLLRIEGVNSVFFGEDFVSVTKNAISEWDKLKPVVLGTLLEHFIAGLPIINDFSAEPAETNSKLDSGDPIIQQIKEIIDTRVRPSVAMDGGDISFESFEEGVVYLKLKGACSGCPSSTETLKMGVENMLKYYVPEVLSVEQSS